MHMRHFAHQCGNDANGLVRFVDELKREFKVRSYANVCRFI